MQKRWTPILLTMSQAYLAGALPAPQFFGQLRNPSDLDCDISQYFPHDELLTFVFSFPGANGASFTHGPPLDNSYPQGNPHQGPGSYPSFQPNPPNFDAPGSAPAASQWGNPSFPQESSAWQPSGPSFPSPAPSSPPAAPNGDQWGNPGGNPGGSTGGNPGGSPSWNNDIPANGDNSWVPHYSSEITYVNPNLSLQTVTVTELPSSQIPTVTSASQNYPDTTGVSPAQSTVSVSNVLIFEVGESYTRDRRKSPFAAIPYRTPNRLVCNFVTS
jgi:hypothetical protein